MTSMQMKNTKQKGATLIEVMVALVIGMLLILAASSAFIIQRKGFGTLTDISTSNEAAREAINIIGRDLRQANYRSVGESPAIAPDTVSVLLGTGTTGDSDEITVRYYGSGAAGAPDGTIVNCIGEPVDSNTIHVDTFRIVSDSGQPWLACETDGVANLLIPNIEALKVRLGIDRDGDNSIDYWSAVETSTLAKSTSVIAMDLSLITVGQGTTNYDSIAIDHFGDGAAVFAATTDHRLRHHERVTIGLRNRMD